jgi:hypothetical protein
MADRSAAAEVRNPLLGLPAVASIRALPLECRAPLAELLRQVAEEADRKAEAAWAKRKGPMAAYWRATCTYAKHTARAIVTPAERQSLRGERPPRAPRARTRARVPCQETVRDRGTGHDRPCPNRARWRVQAYGWTRNLCAVHGRRYAARGKAFGTSELGLLGVHPIEAVA